jgi:hypothetical protein
LVNFRDSYAVFEQLGWRGRAGGVFGGEEAPAVVEEDYRTTRIASAARMQEDDPSAGAALDLYVRCVLIPVVV